LHRGQPGRRAHAYRVRVPGGHHQRDDRGDRGPVQRSPGAGVTTHPTTSRLRWYIQRARQMSPAEVAWRARDQALHAAWSRRQVSREQITAAELAPSPAGQHGFPNTLPPGTAARVPAEAQAAILAAAARLLRG